jgi:protein-S-isoprenylcysteine O-methyltransferase Ste14
LTLGHSIDVLGIAVVAVEVGLLITRRAKSGRDIVSDGRSLTRIWKTVGIGLCATLLARVLFPHPFFVGQRFEYGAAALIIAGMALRWYSIYYLGKQFTVNVAIIEGHRLVSSGPYRLIRHPSYAGLLMIFLGLGIHSNHMVGILALTLPVIWAIHYRIGIEEAAMSAFFGIEYKQYRAHTRKLIPYMY